MDGPDSRARVGFDSHADTNFSIYSLVIAYIIFNNLNSGGDLTREIFINNYNTSTLK